LYFYKNLLIRIESTDSIWIQIETTYKIKYEYSIEMSKSRKSSKKSRRQRRQRRGGSQHVEGAPLNYALAGDYASRASLAQGADYFKYHEGQHGGQAPLYAITDSATSNAMLSGPARLNGLNQAFADIAGLQDGGRRRRSHRRSKRHGGKRRGSKRRGSKRRGSKHCRSKKHGGKRRGSKRRGSKKRRHTRRRGGSLGYSTFPSKGMLLSGSEYSQAGLNPEWRDNVEFDAATIRGSQ